MAYCHWDRKGADADCASLAAMASGLRRLRPDAPHWRDERLPSLERHSDGQHITHPDDQVFEATGFISEVDVRAQLDADCGPPVPAAEN